MNESNERKNETASNNRSLFMPGIFVFIPANIFIAASLRRNPFISCAGIELWGSFARKR